MSRDWPVASSRFHVKLLFLLSLFGAALFFEGDGDGLLLGLSQP
jgi:hypothetical protein